MAKLSKSFTNNRTFLFITAGIMMVSTLTICLFGGLFLLRIWLVEPMGDSLALPTLDPETQEMLSEMIPPLTELGQTAESSQEGDSEGAKDSDAEEMIFLAAAIDYRGDDYLYGLADSIRLVRIDFSVPQINVVSLPRSLLVTVPTDRIQAENPILLNQAYFYGSPGMQHYVGSGYGAGSLAETIQYNFGVTADHYVVVDFKAFIQLVDALGGIEVDLPGEVDDRPRVYYSAGKHVLNGEEALALARIRKKYTDMQRIENQTLILQAIFRKLKDPLILYRLPEVVSSLQDAIFTDVSPEEIMTLILLLQRIDEQDIVYNSPPSEVITNDTQYIPSTKYEMQILRWDSDFTYWLYRSLWPSKD